MGFPVEEFCARSDKSRSATTILCPSNNRILCSLNAKLPHRLLGWFLTALPVVTKPPVSLTNPCIAVTVALCSYRPSSVLQFAALLLSIFNPALVSVITRLTQYQFFTDCDTNCFLSSFLTQFRCNVRYRGITCVHFVPSFSSVERFCGNEKLEISRKQRRVSAPLAKSIDCVYRVL